MTGKFAFYGLEDFPTFDGRRNYRSWLKKARNTVNFASASMLDVINGSMEPEQGSEANQK